MPGNRSELIARARRTIGISATFVILAGGLSAAYAASAAADTATAPSAVEASHLASAWDAPDPNPRVLDNEAVAATGSIQTVLVPTDNTLCSLYATTFTLSWNAVRGHTLTAVVTEDDNFGYGWRALNTTNWTMTASGQVVDEQSPVANRWYLKGTHRSSALCPPDTRSTNHVEIYVDGGARQSSARPIVRPPSRNHLSAVWAYPNDINVVHPEQVAVTESVHRETEQPVGLCQAEFTEFDLTFTALGTARVIAVGLRAPGEIIQYQNGNAPSFGLGVTTHEWFLTGTSTKSTLCPADTLSQDRIEVYTG